MTTDTDDLRHRLEHRLEALKLEYQTGLRATADLENRLAGLRQSLLRIEGAMTVLREEIGEE